MHHHLGAASGGDSPETKPQQSYTPAGGGEERSPGAAGGGRGGAKEFGEADADPTVSGGTRSLWWGKECLITLLMVTLTFPFVDIAVIAVREQEEAGG